MLIARSAKLLSVSIFALSAVALHLSACSDDPAADTGSSSATTTPDSCPATFAQANEKACTNEGVECLVSTTCKDTVYQQATCFCIDGKFQCFNPASPGKAIKGDTPACADHPEAQEACPSDVGAAEAQACTVAGKSCIYVGSLCKGAKLPLQDSCICQLSGDAGLAFDCQRESCPGEAPPIVVPPKDSGAGDGGT